MHRSLPLHLLLLLCSVLVIAAPSQAQTPGAGAETVTPAPASEQDPEKAAREAAEEQDPELGKKEERPIPPELLKDETPDAVFSARLKTQEQARLEELLEHWKKQVVIKNDELGNTFRRGKEQEGAERDATLEKLETIREQQSLRIRRFRSVLTQLQTVTGDVESGKAAADLVAGLPSYVDLTDPNALWNTVKSWVTSKEGGIRLGLSILRFIGILFVFRLLSKFVGKVITRALRAKRTNVPALLRDFLVNTIKKVIFIIGLVIALGEIGVNIAPLVAGIGVLGFVIGFALQDTLGNFAAGVMILINRPFDIGHFIDAAGAKGTVNQMNLFSTTLRTPDNQTIVIPNGKIWGDVITNITGNDTRRIDLEFGIGYEDDIPKAERVLATIIDEHPSVLKDPAPQIKLSALADSSVNFVVRPWVRTADYWDTYFDLTRTVKLRFDEENISIPFPQRDVHVKYEKSEGESAEA